MSKVSIITPAYNAERHIEETVKSVLSQTFADWEMLIVNDCSTDKTCELVKTYANADERIKLIDHEKNLGVAAARNTALAVAAGKYIAFLDSDDLWLPDKLKHQLEFMEKGSYALTYTNYQKFDSFSGERGKVIRAPAVMTAQRIYGDTSIGCLTVMVNRAMVGAFHMPQLKHTEDNVTWQEILNRGYTAYRLDETLSLYREGGASLTSGKKKAAKQQWQTYRVYYEFSLIKSGFYFCQYAFHAVKKHFTWRSKHLERY